MKDYEEVESPLIHVDTAQLGRIALTWFNTKVMTFRESQYDHVQYIDKKGGENAFIPTLEISDFLHENHYPADHRPRVDGATKRWYMGYVATVFIEIKEILRGEDE